VVRLVNLDNFENFIDRVIFERGLYYYENDYILSLTVKGNYSLGVVEGTEQYNVTIELDQLENVVDITCDCPYDMGPYCKHQVAVLLAVRDRHSSDEEPSTSYVTPETSIDSEINKTSFNMRESLLLKSKEELIAFLINIADEYDEIKERIGLYFDSSDDSNDLKKAISVIRSYINKNADRHGFIHYGDTYGAIKGADLVLEKAKAVFDQGKWNHAIDLSLCVVREMIDLIGNADDSDGSISNVLYESFGLIREWVQDSSIGKRAVEPLFSKLLEEANNKRYDDWTDWQLELLESCSMLAVTPTLRNQLEKYLYALIGQENVNGRDASYFKERVTLIRYSMMLKHEGETGALEFIKQHLHYSNFRKIAIEKALQQHDYAQVIELTLEGEAQDKNLLGLVNDWKHYRYIAYKSSCQLEQQRALAAEFILQGKYDFYMELKQTYEPIVWQSIYPKILEQYDTDRFLHQETYPRILLEEGELKKLLEFVQDRPSR